MPMPENMQSPEGEPPARRRGVRLGFASHNQWLLVSLGSAGLLLLALNSRNALLPTPAYLPIVVFAVLGFTTLWIWPPIVILVWTTILQIRFEGHPAGVIAAHADTTLADVAVAFFLLTYLAAFYRSLGDKALATAASARPPETPQDEAIDWLNWLSSVAVWPVAGLMLWSLLPADRQAMESMQVSADVLLLLAAIWLLGGLFIVVRAALSLVDALTMSPGEAKALLVDELYRELRPDFNRTSIALRNREAIGD